MDPNDGEDELLESIPIHISSALSPGIHLHQYPLLSRPLQVPPSARSSGKRIKARAKPGCGRYQVLVPVDLRPEVWNEDRGKDYGTAREEEDEEERKIVDGGDDADSKKKNKKRKGVKKGKSGDSDDEDAEKRSKVRLGEVRMRSEQITSKGDYFVGVMRDGELHLHPISQTHQFRPTLTYLDVLARKAKPTVEEDDDDEQPDGVPPVATASKGPAREIVVAARDAPAGPGAASAGGMSELRREMISTMRKEQEEKWIDMDWHDEDAPQTKEVLESLFSMSDDKLACTSNLGQVLTNITGLTST